MRNLSRLRWLTTPLFLVGSIGAAIAADTGSPVRFEEAASPTAGWHFRFIPYGWLTSMKGTQTTRGRSTKIDASFIDIVEKSDTLAALMGNFEARNGRLGVYGDLVWSKVGVEGRSARTRSRAPNVSTAVVRSLGLQFQMAVMELGAAYEVARYGSLAFDVLAGARYWYQEADIAFAAASTLEIGDLEIGGNRAIARSGSVDWLDPVIGARVRYAVAPGHELFLRGDVAGFEVGSKFSWQSIGGYAADLGTWNGVASSGVLGYRALYVDYVQGSESTRYEFDMLQHGPVLGLSMRW